jgi:hypothetical protein
MKMIAKYYTAEGAGTTTESGFHDHTVVGGDLETRPINAAVNCIIRI